MFAVQQQIFSRTCSHMPPTLQRWHSTLLRSPAQNKTIFALSTPPGKGGIAVVRISGPDAAIVWRRVVRPLSVPSSGKKTLLRLKPRLMYRCRVVDTDPEGVEEELDNGLAVFFPAPNSYTAEPTMELHLHSSPATLKRILTLLSRLPSVRLAERGEFTKRAYMAGRINLLEAEGLRDLINAETEAQRKTARDTFCGAVGARMEGLREEVVGALAMIEALIDFGEGENIEGGVYEGARQRVEKLRETIKSHVSDGRRGEILRSGISVSIFGPPNAGKSSLLNYLAQREAAIVTPVPGTTRDVLELSLDIAGFPVRLCDTAGIRHTDDLVEKIGINRAQKAVQAADLSICVLSLPHFLKHGMPPSVKALLTPSTLSLFNKTDLVSSCATSRSTNEWSVSLATGEGMSTFVGDLGRLLKDQYGFSNDQPPLVTHARHRDHLFRAVEYLDAFLQTSADDVVMAAEELRYAGQEIGKITGGVDVEKVLDEVFKEFCIGK